MHNYMYSYCSFYIYYFILFSLSFTSLSHFSFSLSPLSLLSPVSQSSLTDTISLALPTPISPALPISLTNQFLSLTSLFFYLWSLSPVSSTWSVQPHWLRSVQPHRSASLISLANQSSLTNKHQTLILFKLFVWSVLFDGYWSVGIDRVDGGFWWVLIELMVAGILMGGLNIFMCGLIGGMDRHCIGNPAYKRFRIFYLNKFV